MAEPLPQIVGMNASHPNITVLVGYAVPKPEKIVRAHS